MAIFFLSFFHFIQIMILKNKRMKKETDLNILLR